MEPKIINGGIATDDRGSVRFVNDFNFDGVKRFYQVQNHRVGFIRAWHGHHKEGKYVYVASGTALIGAVPIDMMIDKNIDQTKVFKTVLSANNPKILFIPAGYANGAKTLEKGTIIQYFSTGTLEEAVGDDIRFDYDLVDIWAEDYR